MKIVVSAGRPGRLPTADSRCYPITFFGNVRDLRLSFQVGIFQVCSAKKLCIALHNILHTLTFPSTLLYNQSNENDYHYLDYTEP
jgi:hypothetical protein